MSATLLTLTLVLVLPGAAPEKSRPPLPAVPNFPDLTREQEDAFDKIIDDFIRADAGQLKGEAKDRARDDFERLPSESIYALIRGLNRAALLDSPRPAQAMAKKTAAILRSSTDIGLLEFAHENIGAKEPRKLPKMPSAEEEAKFDKIVDAFIQYDLGNLRGPEGLKAKQAFEKLPPEAVFALIRGLNRASSIDHSCPVTVISKKLRSLLVASKDAELLDYAIENIGGFPKGSRHIAAIDSVLSAALSRKKEVAPPKRGLPPGLVQELRLTCMLRKSEVARGGTSTNGGDPGSRFKVFRPSGKKPDDKPASPGTTSPGLRKPPS